jgi:CrcB protein
VLSYVWVAVGSALGGMARYASSGLGVRWFGEGFPWGTLFVNVTGSLVIGALAVLIPFDGRAVTENARLLLMVGICGGFTTFSAFSLESLTLARNGDWVAAAGYVLGSLVLCVLAVAIGYFGAAALAR